MTGACLAHRALHKTALHLVTPLCLFMSYKHIILFTCFKWTSSLAWACVRACSMYSWPEARKCLLYTPQLAAYINNELLILCEGVCFGYLKQVSEAGFNFTSDLGSLLDVEAEGYCLECWTEDDLEQAGVILELVLHLGMKWLMDLDVSGLPVNTLRICQQHHWIIRPCELGHPRELSSHLCQCEPQMAVKHQTMLVKLPMLLSVVLRSLQYFGPSLVLPSLFKRFWIHQLLQLCLDQLKHKPWCGEQKLPVRHNYKASRAAWISSL